MEVTIVGPTSSFFQVSDSLCDKNTSLGVCTFKNKSAIATQMFLFLLAHFNLNFFKIKMNI